METQRRESRLARHAVAGETQTMRVPADSRFLVAALLGMTRLGVDRKKELIQKRKGGPKATSYRANYLLFYLPWWPEAGAASGTGDGAGMGRGADDPDRDMGCACPQSLVRDEVTGTG